LSCGEEEEEEGIEHGTKNADEMREK